MRKMLKQLTGLVLIWSVLASSKDQTGDKMSDSKEDDKVSDSNDDGKQSDEKDNDSRNSTPEKKHIVDFVRTPEKDESGKYVHNPQDGCSSQ